MSFWIAKLKKINAFWSQIVAYDRFSGKNIKKIFFLDYLTSYYPKIFINSHNDIFHTKSIISYNLGPKLGGSDLRYGLSSFFPTIWTKFIAIKVFSK